MEKNDASGLEFVPTTPYPAQMQPLAALGLEPLATDLERVETELAAAVRSDDPFLGEVAAHLVKAGGKRLRPALTLCTGYAAHGSRPRFGRPRSPARWPSSSSTSGRCTTTT